MIAFEATNVLLDGLETHPKRAGLREALEAETRREQATLGTAEQVQLLFPALLLLLIALYFLYLRHHMQLMRA